MQEDKQNKQIRSVLDGMEQLPEGFSFGSARTWNAIEEKLPGKQQKKTTWHYAAAALLLLAGVSYFTMFTPSKKTGIAQPVITSQTNSIIPPVEKENIVGDTHHSIMASNKKINAKKVIEQNTTVLSAIVKENVEPAAKENIITTQVEQPVLIAVLPDPLNKEDKKKPVLIAAKKPAVKKYRIIHVNDLDAPPPSPEQNMLSKSEFKKMVIQQNEEKELTQPFDNTSSRQLLFFKLKPATTSTNTIVENN